jgi:hypothetical protein
MRNYLAALNCLADSGWNSIADHMRFTLGRQAYHLNDITLSLSYFMELIATTRQGVNQQNFYMREFMFVLNVFFIFLNLKSNIWKRMELPQTLCLLLVFLV